jgi:hypothetical protein
MKEPFEFRNRQHSAPPTIKAKSAVQRAVNKLLDVLAPERATTRTEHVPAPIERYRTPSGCVLQAATAALSVSWFPDAATDTSLGELQVVLWRGVVTRRGTAAVRETPTVVRELTLRPVEHSLGGLAWRDESDGTVYDLRALADNCHALLEKQSAVEDPTGSALPPGPRRRN